jgi:hypothetical protein
VGDDPGWDADSGRTCGHIVNHDSVGTDAGMVPNCYSTEDFRARPNIDMSAESRKARYWASRSDRYLLEDQAVRSNGRTRMNDNSVRMNQEQAAAKIAVQRNICAGDDGPKPMLKDPVVAQQPERSAGLALLVLPDR